MLSPVLEGILFNPSTEEAKNLAWENIKIQSLCCRFALALL